MKKAGKNLLTIIAASTVTFFSLASCVIAVVAWFSLSNQSNVNGNSMRVATAEDGCDIGEISLIKFNYHEETHGSGINEFITIDYLNPATGEVKKYGFNDEYNHFGETVDEAFIPVSTMNIYDPIDLIVTNTI